MSDNKLENTFLRYTKILETFDKVIANDVWQKTSLLKVFAKDLQAMRDNFYVAIDYENYLSKLKTKQVTEKVRVGQLKVFVSIYNSSGDDLDKWYLIIKGVANGVVTRPTYRTEEDVKSIINSKEARQNEGYLVVYINNSDIVAKEEMRDSLGAELTQIKEGSIQLENIVEFVHQSGVFVPKDNKLIAKDLL